MYFSVRKKFIFSQNKINSSKHLKVTFTQINIEIIIIIIILLWKCLHTQGSGDFKL